MLKANLKIISLLKEFLFTVSTNPVYRNQFSTSSTSFTRRRKLTFEILSFFIVNLNKRTLSVELEKYFEQIDGKTKCSVAAFTMQRLKLLPEFFYSWNKVLCASFYSEYKKKVKCWKGFKILACDGSSVSLINRPALQEYFGGQSNPHKYFVLAKTFYCYDVLNKLILHSAINPYKYSEFRMACDLIDSGKLKKDMLLIFDRLYSAYNIVALLNYNEADVKFIIRVNENYNYAKEFIASKKKSAVIELSSTKNSRNQLMSRGYFVSPNSTIKVRLIRIDLPEGKVEVLMTNLWKEEGHRSSEFKYL